ncbi:hypothetical protein V8B55DRAFT_1568959 [Mucor lusitanicus]|uniref:HNH nuclease domain-containing protein n=2 Tax=Mucor circinelloides f. lusitanicus TaxID=29924 RepID=A0A168JWM2_MUCCL|nr:hypothetical protein FB192DRAFT_1431515 [Mucor lusitanicus]OAD01705.1 hypothetical protein MUCCIDRAFT_82102 [Mucor lusitanicus CBS 277.49]
MDLRGRPTRRRYPGNFGDPDIAPPIARRRQDRQRADGIPVGPNNVLAEFVNFSPEDLEGEEWRRLPAPLEANQVSNLGRIKRRRTILTQHMRHISTDRRLYIDLRQPGHRQRGMDDLVLLAFNNDEEQRAQLPYIIHNNGDETNNHLANLRRATYEQYTAADDALRTEQDLPLRRIIRSRRMAFHYNPLLLPSHPDYVQRRYVYQDGQVSNLRDDGRFLRQRVDLAGTRFVEIRHHGTLRFFPVGELMVDSWRDFDPDRRDVIHNDHNLSNLTLDNLQPANRQEYIAHITNRIRVSPQEVFLPVAHIGNIDYSHYIVSNQGRVYALNTKSIISSYDGKYGFECVQLYSQRQSRHYAVHQLVWCAFNGRPVQRGLTIIHADGDRQNNWDTNLREVTQEDGLTAAIMDRRDWFEDYRDPNVDDEYYQENPPEIRGEEWLPIRNLMGDLRYPVPTRRYEVSSYGRVRHTTTRRTVRVLISASGYQYVFLKGRAFILPRLVASCFVDNDDPQQNYLVYHKDGDRSNNHFENLVWSAPENFGIFATATRYLAYRQDRHERVFYTLREATRFNFDGQTFSVHAIKDALLNGTNLNGWAIFRMIEGAVEATYENRLQDQVPAFAPVVVDNAEALEVPDPLMDQDPLQDLDGINNVTGAGIRLA